MIRRLLQTAWALLVPALLWVAPAPASAAETEKILHFHSTILIEADSSLTVTESITVQALGRTIKRGIVRDFPTTYKDRYGNTVRVGFEVVEVRRDGRPEPYHMRPASNGVRIYIGRKDVFLKPGVYRYEITYRTTRQLGFFPEYDELYWNVTGTDWTFPMERVTARIRLPEGASLVQYAAYTGPAGARGKDFRFSSEGGGWVTFETTRPLKPREGLTVAVAWPKGFVAEPGALDRAGYLLEDNPGLGAGLLGLLCIVAYCLVVWARVGRDPKPGTIIPLFHPPQDLSPAAVRYVRRMGFDQKALAATLVNMAVKGYLTIEEEDKGYTLRRTNQGEEGLSPEERPVAEELFTRSKAASVHLGKRYTPRLRQAMDALHKELSQRYRKVAFFTNSKYMAPALLMTLATLAAMVLGSRDRSSAAFMTLWLSIWTVACLLLVHRALAAWKSAPSKAAALTPTFMAAAFCGFEIMGLTLFAGAVSWGGALLLVCLAITHPVFYFLLKAPTSFGRKLLDQIEGFRRYLSVAEEDRLNILHPPDRTPEHFERNLPYAMALDVEQEWCERFAGILEADGAPDRRYRPAWYRGTHWSSLGTRSFAESLGSSFAGAVASASSPPGSSSGSGGGGSSGGGGGGGGGSGW
ncbi:MAG: DUF2207 domain-containing protein [Desulfacinum sp.]|nr:DUF2207 domain-containing protein [Desulfacinum sp.]